MTIEDLEDYFKNAALPESVKLHKSITIVDVPQFIDGHLAVLKQYGLKSQTFSSFYDHLIQLKNIIDHKDIWPVLVIKLFVGIMAYPQFRNCTVSDFIIQK